VLVFRLTGSGLGVTGAVIAEIAPVLLARAGVLPLVDQHLAAVYAVAFGLAAGGVFFNPAASSVPDGCRTCSQAAREPWTKGAGPSSRVLGQSA